MSGLEIVGVAASILGIIDVATKVLASTVDYISAVRKQKETIQKLQTELQSMTITLAHIQQLVDKTDDKSDQSLKNILQGSGADIGEIGRCWETLKELEELFQKYIYIVPSGGAVKPSLRAKAKANLRRYLKPITDAEIQSFTSKLGGHCAKLTLNIVVDSNQKTTEILKTGEDSNIKIKQVQGQVEVVLGTGKDTNQKVTEIQAQGQLNEQNTTLSKLPLAEGAAYNHRLWEHEDRCLPDTRVALLQQIREWSEDPNSPCIYWLNGMAGTGKSTISRTVAAELADKAKLGASFFFSRGRGDIGHAEKFMSTIAAQIAYSIPILRTSIANSIRNNPGILQQGLRDQWKHLILDPLSNVPVQSIQLVVVIDALDECDSTDDRDISLILELLAEAKDLETIRLRILVTSRPETPIKLGFTNIPGGAYQNFVLHDVPLTTVNQDILIFFQRKLALVKKENGLGTPWPHEEVINQLVEKAAGLFIYAATTYRFIQDRNYDPEEQLSVLLKEDSHSGSPTRSLDDMYTKLLQHSIIGKKDPRDYEPLVARFRMIVGSIMIMFNVMPAKNLAELHKVTARTISKTLAPLHSVLNVPEDETEPVRLFHLSFRDFLLGTRRCTDLRFHINARDTHIYLFRKCMGLITQLRENICNLAEVGVLVDEISKNTIEGMIPLHIQYACRYCLDHFRQAYGNTGDSIGISNSSKDWEEDTGRIRQFLKQHFLHWVEALGWVGELPEGVSMIIALEETLKGGSELGVCDPELLELAYDARRWILGNRAIIERAPLQVYNSALLFAPEASAIRKQYLRTIPWMALRPRVQATWSSSVQILEGHTFIVSSVGFSPDGKMVASGSADATIRLWDTSTGKLCEVLEGHTKHVNVASFSPDGKIIASASWDHTVRLWDISTGKSCRVLKGHMDIVNSVVFSPNGRIIASGSYDRTIRLWDTSTGESCKVLKGHTNEVSSVVFSPNGKIIASGSSDLTIRLWDALTGKLYRVLEGHTYTKAPGDHTYKKVVLAFSPNGKMVVSGSVDKTVRLWDASTGKSCGIFEDHTSMVYSVAFSPDGKMIASGSTGGEIRLWDPSTKRSCGVLKGHVGVVPSIAFSPNGKIIASGCDDQTIRLWEASTGKLLGVLDGHNMKYVTSVVFSPDGRTIASTSGDNILRLWDTSTGKSYYEAWEGHTKNINAVGFSPNGKMLASASEDNTVKLWDTSTGKPYGHLEGHLEEIYSVVFSPNGKMIASGSQDKTVRLWDTSIGKLCKVLEGHTDNVVAVEFSPNGMMIASGSWDNTIRLWDASTGEPASCGVLKGHMSVVNSVAFSPTEKIIASGSRDQRVILWDISTGEQCGDLKGHNDSIGSVVFSPNGKMVASASWDHTVRLWDVPKRIIIEVVQCGDDTIEWLRFSSNGTHIHTNRGVFRLKSCLRGGDSELVETTPLLSVVDEWVQCNMKNLVWLPADYRSHLWDVHGDTIVLPSLTGRVTIMTFDCTALPSAYLQQPDELDTGSSTAAVITDVDES